MDQRRRSSSLRQGPDVASDRREERCPSVEQMMVENREGLGMKVIAVMVQRYGVLPRDMWDLNSIADMGAGRGMTYNANVPKVIFESIISNNRHSIFNLTIGAGVSHNVELPKTLRRLTILAKAYDYPFDLPSTLQELMFDWECIYNRPLLLPANLRKLELGHSYNLPLTLPSALVELRLGSDYSQPLLLPQRLERLWFSYMSSFNHPLALPQSLKVFLFGNSYNQPTVLPDRLEEIRVTPAFTHDLSLPKSLRSIVLQCNRTFQLPVGVREVDICDPFDQPIVLPASLKKLTFQVSLYSHPLKFPDCLEELTWLYPLHYEGLVLPERLQKLTWASPCNVSLPRGLRELIIEEEVPLVLPERLVKIKFDCLYAGHYDLPASVQEVGWKNVSSDMVFTHPSTLQHLSLEYTEDEVDLSHLTIHKLTIGHCDARIKDWPQGLKELAFTVDDMTYPLRVPKGCQIVGGKRPVNVIME